MKLKKKLIGDSNFYKMLFSIAVPIMIQTGITNFVNLLDNLMIGQLGTTAMSGVSIVNQIIVVYNLSIFGAVSGAGIFTAQYYGQRNTEGVRHTVRFKYILCAIATIIMLFLCIFFGNDLISLFLKGDGSAAAAASTLAAGRTYMLCIIVGLPFFMITQTYGSTLKACGQTLLPMKAGLVAITVNLVFNYLLIYGKFGFPALGVAGAAIATVLSRIVEAAMIVFTTHRHKEDYPFVIDLYKTFRIPKDVVMRVLKKGSPLIVNETMWGAGMAALAACYSLHGIDVVGALNISNTLGNLFNIVLISMGEAVAIIVGQILGTGDMKRAKDTAIKIIATSEMLCALATIVMLIIAPHFPKLYKTSPEIRHMATRFITIVAFFLPQNALLNTCYFTLRSGGKTLLAFFFDSFYVWCVNIMVAYCLTRFTPLPVLTIFLLVQFSDTIKTVLGVILVQKGIWLHNIVD